MTVVYFLLSTQQPINIMNQKFSVLCALWVIQPLYCMETPFEGVSHAQKQWKPCEAIPLAVASNNDITLWDTTAKRVKDSLYGFAISPDGKSCAAFMKDSPTVVIWKLGTQGIYIKINMPSCAEIPVEMQWLHDPVAVCRDGFYIMKGRIVTRVPFSEEMELQQRYSVPSSHCVANTRIVCGILKKYEQKGHIVQYTFDEKNGVRCAHVQEVDNLAYSLIAACKKYTAVIENTKTSPMLSLYDECENIQCTTEVPGKNILAAEFSPIQAQLLIAKENENNSFGVDVWDTEDLTYIRSIPAPGIYIWRFLWGKKSKNPYVLVEEEKGKKAYILDI